MLSTIFVAVPALSRVDPAITSAPTDRRDDQIDVVRQLGSRPAGHKMIPRAFLPPP
jgi:hypothetical protein